MLPKINSLFFLLVSSSHASLIFDGNRTSISSETLLNQYPFIMTHDSGTGYLSSLTSLDNEQKLGGVVNDWAQTQTTGFGGQLACGARAFDLRPYETDDGDLIMHHGDIKVDYPLTDAVQEVIDFAGSNPDELIILFLSHFDGASTAEQDSKDALSGLGVYVAACAELTNLTVNGAMVLGELSSGGHVLAMDGCVAENYDSSITCYVSSLSESNKDQVQGLFGETCYGDDMTSRDALYAYLDEVTSATPASDGTLSMAQAHWQYDAYSVSAGTLEFSSIIKDEESSEVNSVLAQEKISGYAYLNLLEVDNVCDSGLEILTAIRSRI